MPKVEPFHTNSPEYPPTHRNVYHDHSECKFGKDIKSWHRIHGKAERPRCDECIRLEALGR